MLIELHVIQNFAPSNLNRDDTGAPKDCLFGGVRRARVSSQAWKRAMRMAFREGGLLPDRQDVGTRTKRIVEALVTRMGDMGFSDEEARPLVEKALGGLGLKLDEGKTQYLLFVGPRELDALAALCAQLRDGDVGTSTGAATGDAATAKSGRKAKQDARAPLPARCSDRSKRRWTVAKRRTSRCSGAWSRTPPTSIQTLRVRWRTPFRHIR